MRNQKKGQRGWAPLFATLLVLGMTMFAGATDLEMGAWIDKLKISGDFRLRQENFLYPKDSETKNSVVDRSRQRYRVRLALDLPMQNNLGFHFRFATGGADQVSPNQTLSGLSSKKAFSVDRAYLDWTPLTWLRLAGGRLQNPLWTVYSSDIVFDEDFNPEGFAQNINYLVAGKVNVFFNAMQMVVDERSGTKKDPWLLSNQVGAEVRLPLKSRLRLAYTNHDWVAENPMSIGPAASTTTAFFNADTLNNGNRRKGNAVMNDFLVHELTGQLSFWVARLPASIMGTYIVNGQARTSAQLGLTADGLPQLNRGYQVGTVLGKASAKKSWEAAYFYKKSQTDATVADVSDSDWGSGGTNRRGHILWFAYNPQEFVTVKAKYFITQKDEVALASPGSAGKPFDLNRFQFDIITKF